MVRAKGGKYDAVLPGLPNYQPTDPETTAWQAKVDLAKQTITERETLVLVQKYISLRREYDRLKEESTVNNLLLEAHEQLLTEAQQYKDGPWGMYGVRDNAIRLPSGDTIRVQPEPYASVKDKEAFRQWCIANGYERQLQLMWQTTNGLVKERLLAGKPPPEGCEATVKHKIVFTKAGSE